jgi:branched-chain amino acid transport system permease protein
MGYVLHIFILTSIYIILSLSLDLIAGQAGLLSLSHAGFYGIGAYTSSLATLHLGTSFTTGLLIAIFLSGTSSLLISLPSLRLHDDYFVISTFGFQVILFNIFNNLEITGGPLGITNIPSPEILGLIIDTKTHFLLVYSVFAFLSWLIITRISGSGYGRVLRAIREDEIFAKSLGKNTVFFKIVTFVVSASIAGAAGSLYAHYVSYIDPMSFTVLESILIVAMVIVGGADSKLGPVLGAVLLVLLPEMLRFLDLPSPDAASLRRMLYGALLVIVVMLRPRGLVGTYGFE